MKTLHPALRVSDLAAALAFYTAVGYAEVGRVDVGDGTLVMLKFDTESVVSLELVYRPGDGPVDPGTGFSHIGVQVPDLATAMTRVTAAGLQPSTVEKPGGPDGPLTSWLVDPDGYRLELVQWPPGHADGITADDFRPGATETSGAGTNLAS